MCDYLSSFCQNLEPCLTNKQGWFIAFRLPRLSPGRIVALFCGIELLLVAYIGWGMMCLSICLSVHSIEICSPGKSVFLPLLCLTMPRHSLSFFIHWFEQTVAGLFAYWHDGSMSHLGSEAVTIWSHFLNNCCQLAASEKFKNYDFELDPDARKLMSFIANLTSDFSWH